jgi:hypothetical protein
VSGTFRLRCVHACRLPEVRILPIITPIIAKVTAIEKRGDQYQGNRSNQSEISRFILIRLPLERSNLWRAKRHPFSQRVRPSEIAEFLTSYLSRCRCSQPAVTTLQTCRPRIRILPNRMVVEPKVAERLKLGWPSRIKYAQSCEIEYEHCHKREV